MLPDNPIRAATERDDIAGAATLAIDQYGPEILGYLLATAPTAVIAEDAFARFAEELWRALPGFQWQSSCRTWLYVIARRALFAVLRDSSAHDRRCIPLSRVPELQLAVQRTSRHATYERSTFHHALDRIRRQLDPTDRELLVLRIDRGLTWKEIATVLDSDLESDPADQTRRAATLRKRFERLKDQLRDHFRALRNS